MHNMFRCLIAGWWTLVPVACQNAAPARQMRGAVDGKPTPDWVFDDYRTSATDSFRLSHDREPATAADEQEIRATMQKYLCGRIQDMIIGTAREGQADRLGVVVTAKDLEQERRRTQMPDPHRMREHAAVAVAAFAALDKGEDAKQVYERIVKPHGIDEMEWNVYVRRRKTEGGRAQIQMELSMTDAIWAKANVTDSLVSAARSRKLDDAVDEQIASTDSTFRQYMYELRERARDPDPRRQWTRADHKKYIAGSVMSGGKPVGRK